MPHNVPYNRAPLTRSIVVWDRVEDRPPGGPYPATYLFLPPHCSRSTKPPLSLSVEQFSRSMFMGHRGTVSRSIPFLPASTLLTGQATSFLRNEIICSVTRTSRKIGVKPARPTRQSFFYSSTLLKKRRRKKRRKKGRKEWYLYFLDIN